MILDDVEKYCGAGLALVPIPPVNGKPSKAPTDKGWNQERGRNNPNGYSINPADFNSLKGFNFGLYHGASNTLALDVDNLEQCQNLFEAVAGITLTDWLKDPGRFQVKSPKPNRGKLIFKLPVGFEHSGVKQYKHNGAVIFELRSGNCQDVIVGQHPEGGAYQVIGNPAVIPPCPELLQDMLQNWDAWKPCFESTLGIEPELPKIAPRKPQQDENIEGRRDPIKEFNQSNSVVNVLIRNGYKQVSKDRFIRPGSESKAPGAVIMRNCEDVVERVYSHGGDMLNDGFAHDAFDVFCLLECGGDYAKALNWNAEITKHNQRLFMQAQVQAKKTETENICDIDSLFNELVLTEEHVNKMSDATFLIPNVIVKGHLSVYPAPANGGKSALFRYFSEELSRTGMKVIYINVDAPPDDLRKHFAHAKEHNYRVIAPDACDGKSSSDVIGILQRIADSNSTCDENVFILDTLKKFTDVISKQSKEFYKLLRTLTVRGATICLLGHCNKYKDSDGKHIFEGVGDLRNDVDDMIYFDSFLNEQTNILEVTTRPDKVRANFHPVSFHIDRNKDLKVSQVGRVINILPPDDRDIIETAKQAIKQGNTMQGEIIAFIKERLSIGEKKIKSKLKQYCCGANPELKETRTGKGRTLRYEIV